MKLLELTVEREKQLCLLVLYQTLLLGPRDILLVMDPRSRMVSGGVCPGRCGPSSLLEESSTCVCLWMNTWVFSLKLGR